MLSFVSNGYMEEINSDNWHGLKINYNINELVLNSDGKFEPRAIQENILNINKEGGREEIKKLANLLLVNFDTEMKFRDFQNCKLLFYIAKKI